MPNQLTKKIQSPTHKKKVRVSNDVRIDAKNPIPFEYGGQTFSFINRHRYIPFLPPDDNFAQKFLEARLLSTTNNACITKKARYCAGHGFRDNKGSDLPKEFIQWCKTINRKGKSVSRINRSIFDSHFTHGNTPIEVVRYTVAGRRYFHVYAHNFLEWRLGKVDEFGNVDYAIQSKLFLRAGYVSADILKEARKIPIYSPFRSEKKNWFKDEKGAERTIFWYKNEVTGYDHYGLPSNVAAMIFEILEYKGARYNLDNFDNNMVVAALLALKGNLSPDEANRIGREAIKTHTGDGKRGRVMVVASEEGIDGSDFHQFDTHKEGSYTEADDKWTQKIILANDWDATLAGITSPSTLGKGSGFLSKIIEHILNTVIKPEQSDLFEDVWTHVLRLGNEWMNWGIDFDNMEFHNHIDISGLTDVDITPAVQINEVRKAKGLPEDPAQNGVYMKSSSPKTAKKEEGGDDVQD
jgi:hypothetical protein